MPGIYREASSDGESSCGDGTMASLEDFFRSLDNLCGADGGSWTLQRKSWLRSKGQELRHALLRYQAVLDVLMEGITVRDQHGLLRLHNAAAEKLLGVPLRERLGRPGLGPIKLVDAQGGAVEEGHSPVHECLRTGGPSIGCVFGVVREDGIRWLETNSLPIRPDGQPRPIGVVSSFRDITEKKTRLDRLEREATHDSLTGLPNRRALEAKLARTLESATRAIRPVSLCLCDLDQFKRINDQLGHSGGDRMLRRFADVLKVSLRGEDFPARIGGDEFALLFVGTQAGHACTVIDRIRGAFSCDPGGGLGTVTGTFGIADWSPGMSSKDLLQAADEALYIAKGLGRDRIQVGTGGTRLSPRGGKDSR